jgi:hypothetical protein
MGTAAAVAIAIIHGVNIVRVHDVAEMVQVVRVAHAICDGAMPPDQVTATKKHDKTFVMARGKI